MAIPIEVYGYFDAPQGTDTPQRQYAYNKCICCWVACRKLPRTQGQYKKYTTRFSVRTATYTTIDRGFAVINDGYMGALDYDVDIEVLTSMVFGNDVTRKILDFPATRPFISLMLD